MFRSKIAIRFLFQNIIFPNYQDYGYGIFLLDEKSRNYILANVQNEKDDFLRAMMYGSLWDSVREAELNPKDYVELVIKNVAAEKDETIVSSMLGRANTALNYYIDGGNATVKERVSNANDTLAKARVSASEREELVQKFEEILINKMQTAETLGQRITFYRSFLNVASSEKARESFEGDFVSKIQNRRVHCRASLSKKANVENDNIARRVKLAPTDLAQNQRQIRYCHQTFYFRR